MGFKTFRPNTPGLRHRVQVVNTEMVVFELLGKAGTAEFKALSALVR